MRGGESVVVQVAEVPGVLPRAPVVVLALPRGPWGRAVGEALDGIGLHAVPAADGGELVRQVARTHPDVVLAHERVLRAATPTVGTLLARSPRLRLLYVARVPDEDELLLLLRAGVWGYTSESDPQTLTRCLLAVARGEVVVPRRMVGRLTAEFRARALGRDRHRGWVTCPELTQREWEAVDLLRTGLSTAGIAQRMHVSQATVRTHLHDAMHKLRVHDRDALLALLG